MPDEARFLVLGSNSFSGATFCWHLAQQGHSVLAASRSPEVARAFRPYAWQATETPIRFRQIDLNQDLDELELLVRQEKPSHVVNFAAQSMVGQSWDNPAHWMTTNVVSLVRLLDLLRGSDRIERYVHVTTPEVYGNVSKAVNEDEPFDPSTPYAVSRAAGDMYLKAYFRRHAFPYVATRAANVYGPGQQLYRIIPRTILAAKTGERLQLHGGGQARRSFIHMDDVSEATLSLALKGVIGETYHIATDDLISIRQLVDMILQQLGVKFDDCVEVVGERPGQDMAYALDSSKIRSKFGWQERISIEQGIEDVIAWMERFWNELNEAPREYVHKP